MLIKITKRKFVLERNEEEMGKRKIGSELREEMMIGKT